MAAGSIPAAYAASGSRIRVQCEGRTGSPAPEVAGIEGLLAGFRGLLECYQVASPRKARAASMEPRVASAFAAEWPPPDSRVKPRAGYQRG